ncbi:VOC family protein [Kytococcus sedentarius]|uniref:Uncharacterized conserved protein n=1 Tax=Kytococcus sedentarius (strain ATCC 14392 / DSM 20547 / JCM 11482 / CCUG 33030 / NBRC 15357 / NCTC 11040 / CCM 314 / 541) TaxID=478801 RepID=C7NFY2_KYTSD|nr:VOC family protein [Kytococcus sedentarius]ACV05982.1 uncharacterized conserved protein [Kytococcus sedentarius DSM 20547]QQB64363.1 VOC family protein [Kytococcus sedentarius]STX12599.1 Uncharacterised protein [Kytococcus sedentarius]
MTAPTPYLLLPGTADEALRAYHDLFGGDLVLVTRREMNRTDEPLDAIGHGQLTGPVSLFAADTTDGDEPLRTQGLMQTLLGVGTPEESHTWFTALAEGGTVVDALQERPWGDWDGQVVDRFGLHWLIGYSTAADPSAVTTT